MKDKFSNNDLSSLTYKNKLGGKLHSISRRKVFNLQRGNKKELIIVWEIIIWLHTMKSGFLSKIISWQIQLWSLFKLTTMSGCKHEHTNILVGQYIVIDIKKIWFWIRPMKGRIQCHVLLIRITLNFKI